MMKGAIEFLLSDAREAKLLRKHYIFKIVPMLNPDGVRYGNYRTSLLGVDLNRRWNNPHKMLHPTIYYTKRLIQSFAEDRQLMACVDMHGHSMKKNVFVYGCCVKNSEFEGRRANVMIKLLPYLLSGQNQCFSFKDCKFRLEKSKETTQRIVLFKELGVLNAYTLEASFYGPSHSAALDNRSPVEGEEPLDAHFETAHLESIGRDLCKQFLAFVNPAVFRKKLEYVDRALKKASPTKAESLIHRPLVDLPVDPLVAPPTLVTEDRSGDISDMLEHLQIGDEGKLGNLLDEINGFDNLGAFESFDAQSDSGGSDSCPSDRNRQYSEPRSRPKTRIRIRAKEAKPMKESVSHKQNMLKLRSLAEKRREAMSTSPSSLARNRATTAEETGAILKQTNLRLTLQQHLSQISKIKTLINKSKVPPKVRSRQLLQTDSQEMVFQEPMIRVVTGTGGFRNVIYAQRVRPELDPATSFVVSSLANESKLF